MGAGLVGTMVALVLGLLVASAKGRFDAQSNELTQVSVGVVLLDRTLALYGPEADGTRALLREYVDHRSKHNLSCLSELPSIFVFR